MSADDKTTAEPWPEWATPGHDFDIDGNVWPGSRLDEWLNERAAVRRVAPDRETLGRALRDAEIDHPRTIQWESLPEVQQEGWRLYADALLASGVLDGTCKESAPDLTGSGDVSKPLSGVLGVPADQRTADRETIARAIYNVMAGSNGITDEGWEEYKNLPTTAMLAGWAAADAVLAVLVPADQVRAETLEALAASADLVGSFEPFADWLLARAAEYRKAAGE